MKTETLEQPVENKAVSLDQIQVRNLPELQGWKENQLKIVKDNPFVSIEDTKTYEEAKKNRTALVSARTDIQKQDKLIASKLRELRSEAGKVAEELIAITQPHEDKQQDEVKRFEAEKEVERLEKERIEQERKVAIQNDINAVYNKWKAEIQQSNFDSLEALKANLLDALELQSQKDMEEFEMDFAEKSRLLNEQLDERSIYLREREESRIAAEKLAKERAEFEKQQEESRALEAKQQAEAKQAREAEEKRIKDQQQLEADKLAKERAELEAEKNRIAQEEAERQAKIEAELKAKADAEAKEQEALRVQAEEKRLKALQPDKTKAESFIQSLDFNSEQPKVKDQSVQEYLEKFVAEVQEMKAAHIERLKYIK